MFFKRLVDLKNDKVKFKLIPKSNEEDIPVRYGCITFVDSYIFLSESLDKLVKDLDVDDFKILKKEFPDEWQFFLKKNLHIHINISTISMIIKNLSRICKKKISLVY